MQRSIANSKSGRAPLDLILHCWLLFHHRNLITEMMQRFETRSIWTVKFHSWQPWAFRSVLPVVSNVERCWKMRESFVTFVQGFLIMKVIFKGTWLLCMVKCRRKFNVWNVTVPFREKIIWKRISKACTVRALKVYLSPLPEVVFKFQQSLKILGLYLAFRSWQITGKKTPETSSVNMYSANVRWAFAG